ncbi:MAG TPA: hypothetical protein VGF89_00800 [Steroidobacteraceae bacterium]|jgi:hypothetical protein
MSARLSRIVVALLVLSMLQLDLAVAASDNPEIRAYVNDSCIVADEPYLMPPPDPNNPQDQTSTKFFPLIGLVVGKLTEMLINHIMSGQTAHIKAKAQRKDTRYAMTEQMNLYRADFKPELTLHLNAKLGCMTVVAAKFEPAATGCASAYVPRQLTRETMKLPESQWRATRSDDSIENQLRRANICVDGKARAVYEARFEFSPDGTAYRLRSAGYQIQSLLTTQDKGATRTSFYTLEISQPGKSADDVQSLSTAWVRLGTVSAGAHSASGPTEDLPWLNVPALSVEARRVYDDKTRAQQQVLGEADALRRAITRDQRVQASLDQRIAQTSADVAQGLQQERTKVAVRIQEQQAELDATNAEYQDLPQTPLELMPVTIVVAVTETESEHAGLQALASVIDGSSGELASAVGTASGNLFSRSLQASDQPTTPHANADYEQTRDAYYDAVVAAKNAGASPYAADSLAAARNRYNDARRALGLEPIQ